MSDLYLISDELRALSRSAVEIILPYDAAVKAVRQLRSKRIALLGWEGLIVSATGKVPFCPRVRGTPSIDRAANEDWEAYVDRSSEFCLETMQAEREAFRASPDARLGELFYCLAPLARPASGASTGRMKIGLSVGVYTVADVIRWADTIIETRNAPHPAIIAVSLAVNEASQDVSNRLFDVPGEIDHTEALRYVLRDLRHKLDEDPSSAESIARRLYQFASSTFWPEDELGSEAYHLDDAFELLRSGTYRGSYDDAVRDLRDYLHKTGGD